VLCFSSKRLYAKRKTLASAARAQSRRQPENECTAFDAAAHNPTACPSGARRRESPSRPICVEADAVVEPGNSYGRRRACTLSPSLSALEPLSCACQRRQFREGVDAVRQRRRPVAPAVHAALDMPEAHARTQSRGAHAANVAEYAFAALDAFSAKPVVQQQSITPAR